jgi:hypothetical protein
VTIEEEEDEEEEEEEEAEEEEEEEVVDFSPRRTKFDPHPVHVDILYVVDEVTLRQVSLQAPLFYPVIIIPPLLHTHIHPHASRT